jgi:hypothetical protein
MDANRLQSMLNSRKIFTVTAIRRLAMVEALDKKEPACDG